MYKCHLATIVSLIIEFNLIYFSIKFLYSKNPNFPSTLCAFIFRLLICFLLNCKNVIHLCVRIDFETA